MSIGVTAISELPIGADAAPISTTKNAPRRRRIKAKADVVQQPEAR